MAAGADALEDADRETETVAMYEVCDSQNQHALVQMLK
jgi:hypothetical protein